HMRTAPRGRRTPRQASGQVSLDHSLRARVSPTSSKLRHPRGTTPNLGRGAPNARALYAVDPDRQTGPDTAAVCRVAGAPHVESSGKCQPSGALPGKALSTEQLLPPAPCIAGRVTLPFAPHLVEPVST